MLRNFTAALVLFISLIFVQNANAQLYQSRAQQAILVDLVTGSILFQQDADRASPPASLTKIVTAAVVFDALRNGEIALDTKFKVSVHAWRNGGAPARGPTMFAAVRSEISVANLLRGMLVQMGNDAAIILAEGISESEAEFAHRMNALGRKLGIQDSNFTNASGMNDPETKQLDPNHLASPRDLAKFAQYIIEEHPLYYSIFSENAFKWNRIRQTNRNPLLSAPIGADGMMIGNNREVGYSIVGSAIQDNRRLVSVMMGLKRLPDRNFDARRLLEWGYSAFNSQSIISKGTDVGSVRVYGGTARRVGVKTERDVVALIPKQNRAAIEGRVVYNGPIPVPIKEGDRVAELQVYIGNRLVVSAPLVASETVSKSNLFWQAMDGVGELMFGWL